VVGFKNDWPTQTAQKFGMPSIARYHPLGIESGRARCHHTRHREDIMNPASIEMRVSSAVFDAGSEWASARADRSLLLTVDDIHVAGGRREILVRRSMLVEGALPAAPKGAKTMVMRWVANPTDAAVRDLGEMARLNHLGGVYLPLGSDAKPRGVLRAGDSGIWNISELNIVGPGLRRISLTVPEVCGPMTRPSSAPSPCQPLVALVPNVLIGLKFAIVGTGLGSHVAAALTALGARHFSLIDDGGRVDLDALTTLAEVRVEQFGQFSVDAVADSLRGRFGVDVEATACESQGLAAALSRTMPDLVIASESDPARRAAVWNWCCERQRILIQVVDEEPGWQDLGALAARVHVLLPCGTVEARCRQSFLRRSAESRPVLRLANSSMPEFEDAAQVAALRHRVAGAVSLAVIELIRGTMPATTRWCVRARVSAGADWQGQSASSAAL
jgi:hypothetical protein